MKSWLSNSVWMKHASLEIRPNPILSYHILSYPIDETETETEG